MVQKAEIRCTGGQALLTSMRRDGQNGNPGLSTPMPALTTPFEDITRLLSSAHKELSRNDSIRLLNAAVTRCNHWEVAEGGDQAAILKASALRDLALEQHTPPDRTAFWKAALAAIEPHLLAHPTPALAESYADVSVDCYQDIYSDITVADRSHIIRGAGDYLDAATQDADNRVKGTLLARESSILRHRALVEVTDTERRVWLDRSHRCAKLAATYDESPDVILQLASSEWALARYEKTEMRYNEHAPNVVEGGGRRFWDRFWQNRSDLGANKEGEPP